MLSRAIGTVGVIALASSVEAAFRVSRCPDFAKMDSFDAFSFTGRWYEIARDKLTPFEAFASCANVDYDLMPDNETITVHNKGHWPLFGWLDARGTAVESDITGPASLVVSMDEDKPPLASMPGNFNILSTDYNSYAITYSCVELLEGAFSYDYLWVMAREPEITDEAMQSIVVEIERKIPDYRFQDNHKLTRQGESCPYDQMPKNGRDPAFTQ